MASQTLTIKLPKLYADSVRQKVSSGQYENESDVIISALRALDDEPPASEAEQLERWLREEVVPIALRMEADPGGGYTTEEVLAHLRQDMRVLDEHTDVA